MNKWEYAILEIVFNGESIYLRDTKVEKGFDNLGKNGWELVAVQPVGGKALAFFKRNRQPRPTPQIGWVELELNETLHSKPDEGSVWD